MRIRSLRRGLRSVRARTTIVAVTTVSFALVVGALSLVTILRISLRNGVDRAATSRAQDVASLVRSGALPARLTYPGQQSTIIQVVDSTGVVIATSTNFDGEPPLFQSAGFGPAGIVQPSSGARRGRLSERRAAPTA